MKMIRLLLLPLLLLTARAATVTGHDGKSAKVDNPQRIVSLNTSTYEILSDLGEDAKIVGVDTSTHSILPGAAEKKIINFGHPYYPNLEAVIAAKPDLVIATLDSLADPAPTQLRAAGLNVLVLEPSAQDGIAGLKRRITLVAEAFDKAEQGRTLIAKLDARLAALEIANAKIEKKKAVFFLYTHGPGKATIYGRDTGAHYLIELAGARNAADFTTGMKPLTSEALVQASPDSFILLERGIAAMGTLDAVFTIPGVSLTPAGRNRSAFPVNDNIRWIGSRFLDHVEKLHVELYPDAK